MLKKSSLFGKEAGRYLLMASMTGLMVSCGGSSGTDTDPNTGGETPISEQDFDFDGIPNGIDDDADGDGLDDFSGEDNFVDLDGDGLDDITFLTQSEADALSVVEVSADNPCGSQRFATDNDSSTPDWNDNCLVKRESLGGQFADSLFSAGIQRVLYCSGFAETADYADGRDYTNFADGEFGPASEAATIAFQQSESGLVVDGIVGRQTWAKLQEQVERLDVDTLNETSHTYGFLEGVCAGIPMFYQSVTTSGGGATVELGGWTLARNQPNDATTVPFSYQEPFGRL